MDVVVERCAGLDVRCTTCSRTASPSSSSTPPTGRTCPGGRPTGRTAPGSRHGWSAGSCGGASCHRRRFGSSGTSRGTRQALIQDRTREANRLHTVREDAGVKLATVARAILEIVWHLLTHGTTYAELGADDIDRRDTEQVTRRDVRLLENLGHRVTLEPTPIAA